MSGEQIKTAAYILLCASLSLVIYRSLNRRDYASALFCVSAMIAAYLLRAQIG